MSDNIKKQINEYRKKIMQTKPMLKRLIMGMLPVMKGKDYYELNNIINTYNKAYSKKDWGIFISKYKYDESKIYDIYEILSYFINPLVEIQKEKEKEIKIYERNYKYFLGKMKNIEKKYINSLNKDDKNKLKIANNIKGHDIAIGIYSIDEANIRYCYNLYINKSHIFKRTIVLNQEFDDLYDRFFSYFYFKLEYLSSLPLAIYLKQRKKRTITWFDKFKYLNKLPLGSCINKSEYKKIMDVAIYYKHQTTIKRFPKIEEINMFMTQIFEKLNKNLNFNNFFNGLNNFYDFIEDYHNPFGLTGFE